MKAHPHPELLPVKSSMADGVHYDPHAQALHVRFTGGKVYRYDDVPADKGETLLGAASFGQSFNRLIAGRHPGKQVA